jgi:hypothetical protein
MKIYKRNQTTILIRCTHFVDVSLILYQTAIAMNTDATLNGRAQAQSAITLAGNTVVNPAL